MGVGGGGTKESPVVPPLLYGHCGLKPPYIWDAGKICGIFVKYKLEIVAGATWQQVEQLLGPLNCSSICPVSRVQK